MSKQFLVPILLPADPTNDLEAATKQYVDANAGGGGSVSGTKLSALAAITGAILNALDLIEVVDVSDTTMSASGTNKKITMAELVNYLNTVMTPTVANGSITPAKLANADFGAFTVAGGVAVIDVGAVTGAQIEATSVTNSHLVAMPPLTIKANNTGGTTNPFDITVAQARTMLGVFDNAGSMFNFTFDTTTTPGGIPASTIRLNNATPASATAVYVHYSPKSGVDLKTRTLAATAGDRLYIQDRTNSANYRIYEVTGAPTDNTTYATLPVVHRAGGGSFSNGLDIVAGFAAPPITIATSAPASPLTNDIWIDTT